MENIEKDPETMSITQTLIAQIVKEQDEYVVEMIMKYVKEKQAAGELVLPIIIPEGELRHIINMGLTFWSETKNLKISPCNLFHQEEYINYLNDALNKLERRCEELERFRRDTERQENQENLQECE